MKSKFTISDRSNIPIHEVRRRRSLRRYQILDTPPERTFDRIAHLAAQLLDTPVAVISLVDADRVWFKSHHGIDIQEVAREPGLCASGILHDAPYVLTDASRDPRSFANPLVAGDFGLRFYAGVPLQTPDGHNLGMLCVIDFKPRSASDVELAWLADLAALAVDQMELRRVARRLDRRHHRLLAAHDALRVRATRDALTGLLNRGAVLDRLSQAQALARREQQPLSLAIADLDCFKHINDSHGHAVGDRVLVEVSQRLQATTRASDAIGRIGGEEFLMLMYPCEGDRAADTAERFRRAVCDRPIVVECDRQTLELSMSVSIGVYTVPLDRDSVIEDSLHHADAALYRSKASGRNRVTVASKIEDATAFAEEPQARCG